MSYRTAGDHGCSRRRLYRTSSSLGYVRWLYQPPTINNVGILTSLRCGLCKVVHSLFGSLWHLVYQLVACETSLYWLTSGYISGQTDTFDCTHVLFYFFSNLMSIAKWSRCFLACTAFGKARASLPTQFQFWVRNAVAISISVFALLFGVWIV